ncbi:MAG: F0F1 ATP synthase subunit delta [Lachnospiraceae bacterium]|nr:F0F1 ATP synthase subunit delta [Lachnospiraceae bacterium]
MAKLVSKTYGDALFEVAVEDGSVDSLAEEVESVLTIFSDNEDYIKVLNHPKIPMEEKNSLIKEAFEGKVSNDLLGLMLTVVDKGRFSEIEEILNYFLSCVRGYKKIGTATVTSAVTLSEAEKAKVEKRLLETTAYESFLLEYQVDKSLIGGMIIKIGDRVVDSSIRTKLNNMARELSKVQIS